MKAYIIDPRTRTLRAQLFPDRSRPDKLVPALQQVLNADILEYTQLLPGLMLVTNANPDASAPLFRLGVGGGRVHARGKALFVGTGLDKNLNAMLCTPVESPDKLMALIEWVPSALA